MAVRHFFFPLVRLVIVERLNIHAHALLNGPAAFAAEAAFRVGAHKTPNRFARCHNACAPTTYRNLCRSGTKTPIRQSTHARTLDITVNRFACELALDTLVDLFTMNRDVLRGIDTDSHLITLHAEYGQRYFVPDHHGLSRASCQNQH
jgi:hypothetical protein